MTDGFARPPPGIFSLEGTRHGPGRGFPGTYWNEQCDEASKLSGAAQPAIPGEHLLVYAKGVGHSMNISIQTVENKVPSAAISPVPNHPGLCQVVISVPNIIMQKDDLRPYPGIGRKVVLVPA